MPGRTLIKRTGRGGCSRALPGRTGHGNGTRLLSKGSVSASSAPGPLPWTWAWLRPRLLLSTPQGASGKLSDHRRERVTQADTFVQPAKPRTHPQAADTHRGHRKCFREPACKQVLLCVPRHLPQAAQRPPQGGLTQRKVTGTQGWFPPYRVS